MNRKKTYTACTMPMCGRAALVTDKGVCQVHMATEDMLAVLKTIVNIATDVVNRAEKGAK